MNFKHSAFFYTSVYLFVAVAFFFIQNVSEVVFSPIVFGLPFLYVLTLGLNYYLHESARSRPAMRVNAIMLSSMGRLVGFGSAIVITVFLFKHLLVAAISIYSFLYLVSLGGDIFYLKRTSV